MCEEEDKADTTPEPIVIHASEAILILEGLKADVLLKANFAESWFTDALHEAQTGNGPHSRRREIIFAVCFAESYIVEWVRDEVLRNYQEFVDYFESLGKNLGATDRWKTITKDLHNLKPKLVLSKLDYSQHYWNEWTKLVAYRNGLIHGSSSRPERTGQPPNERPSPTLDDLNKIQAGWPTRVVIELVRHLHQAAHTSAPAWLQDP